MQGEVQKINHRSICTIAEQQSFFVWIRFKSQNWQTRHTIFLYSLIYKFELKLMLFAFGKKLEFSTAAVFVQVWIPKSLTLKLSIQF